MFAMITEANGKTTEAFLNQLPLFCRLYAMFAMITVSTLLCPRRCIYNNAPSIATNVSLLLCQRGSDTVQETLYSLVSGMVGWIPQPGNKAGLTV